MKQKLLELIKTKRLYLDGGTGTVLQAMGLEAGTPPEIWNLTQPEKVVSLHKSYFDAGANIVCTNTFGVNCKKYENFKGLIISALENAKKAREECGKDDKFIALDIGPTGRLLEPLGELGFEEAVEIFAENIRVGAQNGADLVLIETMNDSLETKAAVVAAKENCDLPIFVTNVYDSSSKLMTGASPSAMAALLEGLGVTAYGTNCSLGPDKMLSVVKELASVSSLPIIVKPNAGLPIVKGGETVFDLGEDDFAKQCRILAQNGACILGGCCGTSPEYIQKLVEETKDVPYIYPAEKNLTVISSYTHEVKFGDIPRLIGERINPTGKKKLKEALRSGDMAYLLSEAVNQTEAGAHILDVNVGLPEIDEKKMMTEAVKAIQAVTDLPLQIDSSNPAVLERAMRVYNGKPLINSVNGTKESMDAVFPLVKKYGGTLIALTLDENGIPENAEGRVEIAEKIAKEAAKYGISQKDILVDPLAMSVSADKNSALVTLSAIKMLKMRGFYTSLGVSNVSFGLPNREIINSTFFTLALQNGLDAAIINPFAKGMTDAYYSYVALCGKDEGFADYIGYAGVKNDAPAGTVAPSDLQNAIEKGLCDEARDRARTLCEEHDPLEIINTKIIPALENVGKGFEDKKIFLPQLLMSAESASAAFEVIKEKMPKEGGISGRKIILATVRGDIHDIGKNIVKVLLESHGFEVIDLGRDVAPEAVVDAVCRFNCDLVGLSALMTTTVPAMEETVKLLKAHRPSVKTVVGGAVLNKEYADMIGATFYSADAMDTVRFAQKFYEEK